MGGLRRKNEMFEDGGWLIFIFGILLLLWIIPWVLCVIDFICNTHLSCSIMGHHNGKGAGVRTFDGCSVHAECSKCGKHVMQDGQGNWF